MGNARCHHGIENLNLYDICPYKMLPLYSPRIPMVGNSISGFEAKIKEYVKDSMNVLMAPASQQLNDRNLGLYRYGTMKSNIERSSIAIAVKNVSDGFCNRLTLKVNLSARQNA